MTTIDQVLAEKLSSWYVGEWPVGNFLLCIIALVLSVILCGAIGMERELRGRSAGLRTHLLVGVGSCIIMIVSIYGFPTIKIGDVVLTRDVARLAAQVVTGVGFLGAGAIIHRNSGTRGLTTAATIWIVMAIGLSCGSMNFVLATSSAGIIMLVLVLFRKVEGHMNQKSPLVIATIKPETPTMASIVEISNRYACTIRDLRIEKLESGDMEATFLAVSHSGDFNLIQFVAELEALPGISSVVIANGHKA